VFGVVSNGQFNTWSYSKSAVGPWADGYLRPALTDTVNSLVVADFDVDGRADAAMLSAPDLTIITQDSLVVDLTGWTWAFSYDGVQDWQSHQITPTSECSLSGFSAPELNVGFLVGVGRASVESCCGSLGVLAVLRVSNEDGDTWCAHVV
jgi:hypothetical protein